MTTQTYTGTLHVIVCCNCHAPFGMTDEMRAARLTDHETFWCPNGHRQHFTGLSEAEKLRRRNDALKSSLEAARSLAQRENYRARAAKGQVTKIKRRVARGVCPCCNRTFANLASHMEGQHPDFGGES